MGDLRREFEKTVFTETGRPRLNTTISLLSSITGDYEDITVVGHLVGRGPEGRHGLVGIVVEFSDGDRASLEWPLALTPPEIPSGADPGPPGMYYFEKGRPADGRD